VDFDFKPIARIHSVHAGRIAGFQLKLRVINPGTKSSQVEKQIFAMPLEKIPGKIKNPKGRPCHFSIVRKDMVSPGGTFRFVIKDPDGNLLSFISEF
jgi:hypothetical protein